MSIPTIKEIAGVLTEPEMRFTSQGKAVMSVRLAFNDSKYNEQTSSWENSKTFYVDATAWEQTAERLVDQIRKGDQVFVEGRLETQSWEKDGEKKSKPSLTIRSMRKLEKGTKPQGTNNSGFNTAPASNGGQGDVWGGSGSAGSWSTPSSDSVPF